MQGLLGAPGEKGVKGPPGEAVSYHLNIICLLYDLQTCFVRLFVCLLFVCRVLTERLATLGCKVRVETW